MSTNLTHRRRPIRAASLAATLCVALTATSFSLPSLAKVMQAPGSSVSIDLPDRFKPAAMFAGFIEIHSSAAVVVQEFPASDYSRVAAGFSAKALAAKGLTDIKELPLKRTGEYVSLSATMKHPRATYERFMLVFKNAKNTAVVTFNVPQTALAEGHVLRTNVIKALASAKLEAKAAPSRDLFSLGYIGPYRPTGQPTGTSRTYTDANDKSPKGTRNIIVIAPSLNRLPINNLKEFSEYAIKQLKTIKDAKTERTKELPIDGMSGYEIKVSGKRAPSNTPVVVQQLMLSPKSGGYYRLLAITKQSDAKRLAPDIDKIFASFKAAGEISAQ